MNPPGSGAAALPGLPAPPALGSKPAPAPGQAPQPLTLLSSMCAASPDPAQPQPLRGERTGAACPRPGGYRHSQTPSAAQSRRHGPPPCLFTAARPGTGERGSGGGAVRAGKSSLARPSRHWKLPRRPEITNYNSQQTLRGRAGGAVRPLVPAPLGGRTTFPSRVLGPARGWDVPR